MPVKTNFSTSFESMKRLIAFVEAYAQQDAAFAQALDAALTEGKAPPKKKAKAATPKPRSPIEVYVAEGIDGLRAHLATLDAAELLKAGKAVGLKVSKKEAGDGVVERIVERIGQEVNRGQVFSR